MRKILFCILLFSLPAAALDVNYRVSTRGGIIMPDGKVALTPSVGAEFAVSFKPNWQSLEEWNHARIGVALSYWKLDVMHTGEKDLLGHAIAPYVFAEIPFYSSPHFEIGIRPGVGCSFVTKTYFNTVPPDQIYTTLDIPNINQSIGSVFNYYFPEALYFNFPIRSGWSVGLAAGWYHMSNGSIKQPNSGYNIFCGELNVSYRPEDKDGTTPYRATREYSLQALRDKKCEIEFTWGGAARQVYYKDRQTFFCTEMQVAAYWRAHRIFRLGGGVDVFYDGAYYDRPTKFKKTYLTGATQADCWRVGLSLQPEFVFGHLTAGFHFGVYVYDPIKNRELNEKDDGYTELWGNGTMPKKGIFYSYDLINAGSAGYPDGWLYTQIAVRYRLPYHLFVHATMKAHLTKVEFVCAGLGVYL